MNGRDGGLRSKSDNLLPNGNEHQTNSNATSWELLPGEIRLHLFSFLNEIDLSKMKAVSRQDQAIAKDNSLWKVLLANKLHVNPDVMMEKLGTSNYHDTFLILSKKTYAFIKLFCKMHDLKSHIRYLNELYYNQTLQDYVLSPRISAIQYKKTMQEIKEIADNHQMNNSVLSGFIIEINLSIDDITDMLKNKDYLSILKNIRVVYSTGDQPQYTYVRFNEESETIEENLKNEEKIEKADVVLHRLV